ncbi:MAG: hypothetical protein LUD22_01870 [Coprobacillus sp.]|nr:hypothetical protein [Coprobacillus sp.]
METRKEKYADYRASILSGNDDILKPTETEEDSTNTRVDLNPSPLTINDVIKSTDDDDNKFVKQHRKERILWASIIILIVVVVAAILAIVGILLF